MVQHDEQHRQRTVAHSLAATQVPNNAHNDHGRTDGDAVPASIQSGEKSRDVGYEQRWINGHVEDAGGEREPSFLESPERTGSTTDPYVIAAFRRNRARKLPNHQSCR